MVSSERLLENIRKTKNTMVIIYHDVSAEIVIWEINLEIHIIFPVQRTGIILTFRENKHIKCCGCNM